MKVNIVRVGNSRGIRIPKPLLEQCALGDEVELNVKNGSIVISPAGKPRAGWDEAFAKAASSIAEQALLPDESSAWDKTEWRW